MTTTAAAAATDAEAAAGPDPDRARRRPPISVRVRILGFVVLLLALAVGAGLVLGRSVLLARLDRVIDDGLDQEVEELRRLAVGRDPRTGEPFGDDVEAVFATFLATNIPSAGESYATIIDGRASRSTASPVDLLAEPDRLATWATLERSQSGSFPSTAGPVRYQAVPLAAGGETAGVFVVVNFTQEAREEIESFIRVSAVVSALVLLLTGGLAWLVAGRILRPVRDLTQVATAITETDLGRRIEVRGDDEIAALTRTFNTMLDRLQSAFDSQRAFVDDAGHELRTPITIVRGHLELMDDDPEDRRQTLELVTDELDRMHRIVDDLVVLAKAERPDFLRVTELDLDELVLSIDAKARSLGPDRAWTVRPGVGLVIGDRDRLTQAVLNLVGNAVAHTGSGDVIEIGGTLDHDGSRLWVRDSGEGIAREDQSGIFERFRRGASAPRRSDGAGLGLSIVSAIADAHGGSIDLLSQPGEGSTFTLHLPLDPETDQT